MPIRKRSLTACRTADRLARTFLLVNLADDVGDGNIVCATYPSPIVVLEALKAWAIEHAAIADLNTRYLQLALTVFHHLALLAPPK